MSERVLPKATGDCFKRAVDLFMALVGSGGEKGDLRLVHGMVTGTGGSAEGVRYCHAWVEQTVHIDGVPWTMCKDASQGRGVQVIPAALYYWIGAICEGEVTRYSMDEVGGHIMRTCHYGPWEAFPEPQFVEEAA